MFQSISWADFYSVVGLTVLSYYAVLGLILYRNEIVKFFKYQVHSSSASENSEESESHQSHDLMGSARPDSFRESVSREVSIDSDQLIVVSEEEGEPVDVILTGEARLTEQQNLLDEVQMLLQAVSADHPDAAVSLFRALLDRYADLADLTYRNHVSVIIHDGCRQHNLDFPLQEVQSWWPSR